MLFTGQSPGNILSKMKMKHIQLIPGHHFYLLFEEIHRLKVSAHIH